MYLSCLLLILLELSLSCLLLIPLELSNVFQSELDLMSSTVSTHF